jgi:ABC-type amino acid transport substrate-binding protein
MNGTVWGQKQRCHTAGRVISLLLVLAGVAMPADARSLTEIKKSKELRICIVAAHPSHATAEPAHCREKCKFTGPVYEEAKAFAASLGNGVRSRFLRVGWDEQFFGKQGKTDREAADTPELLASGKCDLYASNMTKNEWRLKKLDIVTLYSSRMMVISAKAMAGKIKAAPALAGKTAAIEKDTSYHTWLEEQNQAAYSANPVVIKLLPTQNSFAAVDAGEVDFTLADSDAAIWAVRYQLKNAKTAFPVGPVDEIGWAFNKADKDLQATVQKFFDNQRKADNSLFNQIWERYFGIGLNKFNSINSFTR